MLFAILYQGHPGTYIYIHIYYIYINISSFQFLSSKLCAFGPWSQSQHQTVPEHWSPRVATGRHHGASSDSSELRAPPPATCVSSYRLQRPSTTFRNREGPWTTLQRHFNDNADHKDSDLSHLSQPRLPWLESSNRVESYLMVANEKRAFTLCIHSAHIKYL